MWRAMPSGSFATPEQYESLVKNAPKHEELMEEMDMGHDHEHGSEHQ
jgi:hypothetical protein